MTDRVRKVELIVTDTPGVGTNLTLSLGNDASETYDYEVLGILLKALGLTMQHILLTGTTTLEARNPDEKEEQLNDPK